MQTPCARFRRVTLDVPAPGKFKCPRCGAVLAVEPTGRTRFFAIKTEVRPISLSVPANSQYADFRIAQTVAKCAESLGFKSENVSALSTGVSGALRNAIERAYDSDAGNTYHVLIMPDASAMTGKISDYGKPFDFGAGGAITSDARVCASGQEHGHRRTPTSMRAAESMVTLIKLNS